MKRLGYSLTWRTNCFIEGGCGAQQLFGHTNGRGDFVLLDELGGSWPVHTCYESRYCLRVDPSGNRERKPGTRSLFESHLRLARSANGALLVLREDRAAEYKQIEPPLAYKQNDEEAIKRTDPEEYLSRPLVVIGVVREVVLNQVTKLETKLGGLGQILAAKALGMCKSQITIHDLGRNSYTCFIDLRRASLKAGDLVEAKLRAATTPFEPPVRFVCQSLVRAPLLHDAIE